ncbi:uncharacterized protein K02A2.6-like [Patiria miniata]|uniref:Integrase catalytic domain-containing protein n=1 Tax=Patiria miniata TaxID=46514 RepID=A0A914B1M9_PATMI|nr:uncharacterized protein K02A2.6-like [Patiria miniata]
MVKNCNACLTYQKNTPAEKLQPHPVPNRAWEKVGADFTVDYFSQFIEVCTLSTTTSRTVIKNMKSVFSRQGTPCEVFTDNGPQFGSAEFKRFTADWDFVHSTSSPQYPQSNGLAGSAVKIIKNMIRKAACSGQDIYKALQINRSSPLECGKSPAELLYNQRIRTNLPIADSLLEFQHLDTQAFRRRKMEQKSKQSMQHQKQTGAHALPQLQTGDTVRLLDMESSTWSKDGVVIATLPNQSYMVQTN